MEQTKEIAKQINTKVHEQRQDLVEINDNVEEALKNAEEAEENIEGAQGDQKSTGKCLYYVFGAIAAVVIISLIIVLIAVL